MTNHKFDRAVDLFTTFLDYCAEEGIFVVSAEHGVVRLYDRDEVHATAEREFSDRDDPILWLIETLEGVFALDDMEYVDAGVVDMVF